MDLKEAFPYCKFIDDRVLINTKKFFNFKFDHSKDDYVKIDVYCGDIYGGSTFISHYETNENIVKTAIKDKILSSLDFYRVFLNKNPHLHQVGD